MSKNKKVDCDNYDNEWGCGDGHPMNFCYMDCEYEDDPKKCPCYRNRKKEEAELKKKYKIIKYPNGSIGYEEKGRQNKNGK